MKNNVDPAIKQKIIKIIELLAPEAKIYLFGSRARGTHAEWSDIDIALDAGKELPRTAVDEIASVLAATNILYKVEVVDFHKMAEAMQAAIKNEGIVWKP
jgi:predicted nucleotidyltransferase